jgi:hypothetical protein
MGVGDSVVGTMISLQGGQCVLRIPEGARGFPLPYRPDWLWGPPSLLVNGCGGKAAGA